MTSAGIGPRSGAARIKLRREMTRSAVWMGRPAARSLAALGRGLAPFRNHLRVQGLGNLDDVLHHLAGDGAGVERIDDLPILNKSNGMLSRKERLE